MDMTDDEDMSFHTVLYKGFLKVIVLIPEKEIIAMLFMKTKSVEYLLNVSTDCYSIFMESHENSH